MSPALTSLLNSLHSHLQSQTELLPKLHAQLGLPPTTLEDELTNLQQQLMQSVDASIDARRKEVEEWVGKCEAVENECIRYAKALGGNVKATGSSVGELRKEKVLPQRYQIVSEYREKLRQLYHSKLEQLSTLTNRLIALCRTLGPDFYTSEITEWTSANGENSHDPSAHREVTPERFSKLEKELVRGKAEVAKRLTQLSATMIQIDWLYTELGIPHPILEELPSPLTLPHLPSSSASGSGSNSNADLFLSVSTCYSTPTPSSGTKTSIPLFFSADYPLVASEGEYQRIFARFVARIEEADAENLTDGNTIPIGLEHVEPTPGLLAWASSTRASLEDTKKRREAHIQAMYDQLEALWRRLGVTDSDMDAFVEEHRGSTEETVREYEMELERMLELKRERMSVFVANAREEIERLWEDLMVGEEERADFAPFVDDEYTEELLSVHEEEIKRLKEERRMKAPLLAGIKRYFEICQEEKELASAASDQSRLLGRGSRDPGRLLREEKMRKRVCKEKPRLEQDLLASIPAWEDVTKRQFLVHGESIMQILMETVSAADQENRRKPPRAGSVPPRATTPVNSWNHYVPGSAGYGVGGKIGVVTPAVRSGSSMGSNSAPNKRQRVAEPPSGHYITIGGQTRAPLGAHRGQALNTNQQRPASPTKTGIPGKTPTNGSSLPRPVAMPIPKPGTQHHGLGHGRVPSGNGIGYSSGYHQPSQQLRASSSSMGSSMRLGSSGPTVYQQGIARKASRARRESFKPRPSIDGPEIGVGMGLGLGCGRWGEIAGPVKEEDEGY